MHNTPVAKRKNVSEEAVGSFPLAACETLKFRQLYFQSLKVKLTLGFLTIAVRLQGTSGYCPRVKFHCENQVYFWHELGSVKGKGTFGQAQQSMLSQSKKIGTNPPINMPSKQGGSTVGHWLAIAFQQNLKIYNISIRQSWSASNLKEYKQYA